MPTYDYVCNACNHQFELFQSITAAVRRKCPQCGRWRLRRLIGPGAAILFKGSGFHQTDYRSDSYRKAAAAVKKADGGGSSDGKTSDGKTSDGSGKSKAQAESRATGTTA